MDRTESVEALPPISGGSGESEAKHTPGPWRLSLDKDSNTFRIQAGDRAALNVCQVLPIRGANAANGNLIAASPEMLELIDHPILRQLFGEIEDSGTPEATRLWMVLKPWLELRDAVLAKL